MLNSITKLPCKHVLYDNGLAYYYTNKHVNSLILTDSRSLVVKAVSTNRPVRVRWSYLATQRRPPRRSVRYAKLPTVLTSAAAEVEESHDQDKGKTRGVFDVSTQMLGPHLAPTYIRASLYLAYVTSPVSPSKGWKGQKHPRLRNIRRGNELGDWSDEIFLS